MKPSFVFFRGNADRMLDWLQRHETLIGWLGIFSLATILASMIATPLLVVLLPADYFVRKRKLRARPHWKTSLVVRVVRNLLGGLLVIVGVGLLFMPGQGVLTILVGVVLSDLPGKRALLGRLVRFPRVLRGLNWIRAKWNRPPFEMEKAAK